jgi:NAD-dependent dihydropyrimidine dehydrogenase PreA subunit
MVGGQDVGIAFFDEIMAKGLEAMDKTDEEQKRILLEELKKHNYVPGSIEDQYLVAVWIEFRHLRAKKRGDIEEEYHGVPREEIQWFPRINYELCTNCGLCFEFCKRGVFTFDDGPKVSNPYRCVVSCTGCKTQCEEEAISFPSLVELREELKNLRKMYMLSED